jgi:uncharacterized membrane protein
MEVLHHWWAFLGLWFICLCMVAYHRGRTRAPLMMLGLLFWSRLKLLTDLSPTAIC